MNSNWRLAFLVWMAAGLALATPVQSFAASDTEGLSKGIVKGPKTPRSDGGMTSPPEAGEGCGLIAPLKCPTSTVGDFSAGDCTTADGSLFDVYEFPATSGQLVVITLSSTQFSTGLTLVNPSGQFVEFVHDSSADSAVLVVIADETGIWRVTATNTQQGTFGPYALTLDCLQASPDDPDCGQSGALTCPLSAKEGELTASDCVLDDGSFFDSFQFDAVAGQAVVIDMRAGFDTFLFLLDPSGQLVEQNDDFLGLNSRIERTINVTGTWRVLANSYSPGTLAPYTLSLVCLGGPVPTPTPTPIPTPTPTAPASPEIPLLSLRAQLGLAVALALAAITLLRRT
jgi:hypothetical protein